MADTRRSVVTRLLEQIREVSPGGRALLAIDGLDGAGKSVLVKELVDLAKEDDLRPVTHLSIDGFHLPRAVRHAHGTGPDTFYRESYDYAAFTRSVVAPFRSGSSIIPAVWDVSADSPVPARARDLPTDCALLVDGIFLHRRELRDVWDASVWVEVPFAVSVPRGNQRFPGKYDPDPGAESNHRYVGGQRLYFAECSPWDLATWVVDNEDLAHPRLSPRLIS